MTPRSAKSLPRHARTAVAVARVVVCTVLANIIVAATWIPACNAQTMFNEIQFSIQTGHDFLARGNAVTATVRSTRGNILEILRIKAENQPPWVSGSTHAVTALLRHRQSQCEIGSIDITLHKSSPSDNNGWSILNLTATLSVDNVDQTPIVRMSGVPVAELKPSQPSFHANIACKVRPSLYDRLGRRPGILKFVDDFIKLAENDNRIRSHMLRIASNPQRLREFRSLLADKVCELSGGPCRTNERAGKSLLAEFGAGVDDYWAFVTDLAAAMDGFPGDVSTKDKNELLGAPIIGKNRPRRPSPRVGGRQIGVVGSEVASPIFVNLYWDSSWDQNNRTEPKEAFDSYTQAVIGSSYFAGLSEYGVGAPIFGGGFLPSPSCTQKSPGSVGFYDPVKPSIIGFLQCELDSNASLPQGDNVIYNIILPQQSIENDSLAHIIGARSFCVPHQTSPGGWHFHGTPYSARGVLGGLLGWAAGTFVGVPVQGAVIGFLIALSQQGGPLYTINFAAQQCGNLTQGVLHEMVETVTDPFPPLSVILNNGEGEIVDICDQAGFPPSPSFNPLSSLPNGVTLTLHGFLSSQAPQYFSNSGHTCIKGFSDTTAPQISSVTLSGRFPGATGTIAGSGFGAIPPSFVLPTSANLPYSGVQNESTARNWQAGNSLNSDPVAVTLTSWNNTAISIGGFSPPDGSRFSIVKTDEMVVWVCNPSSGVCSSLLFRAHIAGNGLNSKDIISINVTITTGDDNARADTELWLSAPGENTFCLKPSNNAGSDSVCSNGGSAHDQNGRQEWKNGSTDPSPQIFKLSSPVLVLSVSTITLMSHDSFAESPDNWDIQDITINGLTRGGQTVNFLGLTGPASFNSGNCIARLKAAPNASSVIFTLDGSNGHTYLDGTAAERGSTTTCTNNGG